MDEQSPARDAAAEAARALQNDAKNTLNDIKKQGVMGFFSFDTLYFPKIARFVFIVVCILSVIGMALGVLGGLVAMAQGNLGAGMGGIIVSIVGSLMWMVGLRIWFEMMMVAFKINGNIEKLLEK